MSAEEFGALCFGVVVGWVTYRSLRRTAATAALSDISAVIGAVGGAAVTSIFDNDQIFAWYCMGLAAGFFAYLVLGHTVFRNSGWLGDGS